MIRLFSVLSTRIRRFYFPPPNADDAISPHSPLRSMRKSLAYATRVSASRAVGHIGTRQCGMCGIYNFKAPHSLRSTVSLRFRCHTTLTLFPHILSAGWRWQSDTSLAHVASTALTSSSLSTPSRRYTFISSHPLF